MLPDLFLKQEMEALILYAKNAALLIEAD